ncbi:MAG: hypothetical protein NT029_09190 [Armatimonadetes bacterium]|nr:hypothetical protein [Armatimonadota bacterium]
MPTALRLDATVLPGHRLEVTAPELPEGALVRLIVMLPSAEVAEPGGKGRMSMLDLIDSLPQGPRSAPTWEAVERGLRAERDAWDR